ncbi:MAG: 30S ribosome-binding factor RbfA [Lachnospiraceae bacterium]|nr:30S ribosome-binding factor RbfA [Lachnospiraceae bacterium]
MRKNSIKNIRINEEVRRQLQEIVMRQLKDPRVDPMTSVTKVEVAPDLKTCRAYISVLGNDEALSSTVEGLTKAEGYIRRELARTVNLRNTPSIRFIADDSIAYGVGMSKIIDEVIAQDERRHVGTAEDKPENMMED